MAWMQLNACLRGLDGTVADRRHNCSHLIHISVAKSQGEIGLFYNFGISSIGKVYHMLWRVYCKGKNYNKPHDLLIHVKYQCLKFFYKKEKKIWRDFTLTLTLTLVKFLSPLPVRPSAFWNCQKVFHFSHQFSRTGASGMCVCACMCVCVCVCVCGGGIIGALDFCTILDNIPWKWIQNDLPVFMFHVLIS